MQLLPAKCLVSFVLTCHTAVSFSVQYSFARLQIAVDNCLLLSHREPIVFDITIHCKLKYHIILKSVKISVMLKFYKAQHILYQVKFIFVQTILPLLPPHKNVKGDRKEHIVMQMPSRYHTEAMLQIIIVQGLHYKCSPAADHVWIVNAVVGA